MKVSIFNKNFWQKTALILGGFVFALILVEIILRIFWSPSIITDPYLGWRGHGIGFDTNGFRNEKALDQADVAVMGDSMTYGAGSSINQAWPQVLAKISQKNVYQMALGGYGPVQYSYLLDQAVKMKAKTVVFGFFIGNDFYDVLRMAYTNKNWQSLGSNSYTFKDFITPGEAEELGNLIVNQQSSPLLSWLQQKTNWLTSRLYLNQFITALIANFKNHLNQSDMVIFDPKVLDYLKAHPEAGYLYNKAPQETLLTPTYSLTSLTEADFKEATRIIDNVFLQSQDKAKQNQTSLIIAIIPTKELVYANALLKQGNALPEFLQNIYNKEQPSLEQTKQFCQANNLNCVSLIDPLVESFIQGEKIYHSNVDGHPNAQGYQVIANAIFDYLKNNVWKN